MTGTDSFSISRTLDAPRELVFACFADPKHLVHWWGPKGVEIVNQTMDFRPGGTYHYGMRWPTGVIMWGLFKFRDIAPPSRIVFLNCFSNSKAEVVRAPFFDGKWPLEMLTEFDFEELGPSKTQFRLNWTPHDATPEEIEVFAANHASAADGWAGSLDKLEALVTTLNNA